MRKYAPGLTHLGELSPGRKFGLRPGDVLGGADIVFWLERSGLAPGIHSASAGPAEDGKPSNNIINNDSIASDVVSSAETPILTTQRFSDLRRKTKISY